MTSEEFRNLNRQEASAYNLLLQALWQDVHSDWQSAHELAQGIETPDGAWVHAYLHRKEGDEEWGLIVTGLLQKQRALSGGVRQNG